jgi:type II secretory pathway component PulJ
MIRVMIRVMIHAMIHVMIHAMIHVMIHSTNHSRSHAPRAIDRVARALLVSHAERSIVQRLICRSHATMSAREHLVTARWPRDQICE